MTLRGMAGSIAARRDHISLRPQQPMQAWVLRVIVRTTIRCGFSLQSFCSRFQKFDGMINFRGWAADFHELAKAKPYLDVRIHRASRTRSARAAFLEFDRCLRRGDDQVELRRPMVPEPSRRGAFAHGTCAGMFVGGFLHRSPWKLIESGPRTASHSAASFVSHGRPE